MGILYGVTKKRASKRKLKAQAKELVELQGSRTVKAWCAILDVRERTYYRYKDGTREAPGFLMALARIKGPE